MATLTVCNLEDDVVRRLWVRAAEHGRSAEAEHREILRAALAGDDQLAARRQAADRLADFRRRTARRGPACATELLSEARSGRLRALTRDEHEGGGGA
jgi:plasmid stability protein